MSYFVIRAPTRYFLCSVRRDRPVYRILSCCMSTMKFCVFFGSCRDERLGFGAAKYIVNLLKSKKHEVFLFDPLERQFPIVRKPYHFHADPSEIPQYLTEVREEILSADGYFVVSAEYNHSIPPALSNALNHFAPADYQHKPCGIVTYSAGMFGGVAAAIQLRAHLGILGMVTPGYMFSIPKIMDSISKDGEPQNDHIKRGGDRIVTEVEWYAAALTAHRNKCGTPSTGTVLL